jgi:hypothetical protein
MSQMTKYLKMEVLTDIYIAILKKSQLLKESFSSGMLGNLCQSIKEKKFAPDEIIF